MTGRFWLSTASTWKTAEFTRNKRHGKE